MEKTQQATTNLRTTVLEKETEQQAALREYEAKCAELYQNYDAHVSALISEFGTVEYFDDYDYKAARAK